MPKNCPFSGSLSTFTHSCEVLRTAVLPTILAVQQHFINTVAGPLYKLQHVEGLAGEELAVVRLLSQSSHKVIKVTLLHSEQSRHPEEIIADHFGASEAVVVAESDGWKEHDGTVHFIQDGDVRIAEVVHHGSGHLVEEDGERGAERRCPEQTSKRYSSRQEDMAQPMKGAVGPENSDI